MMKKRSTAWVVLALVLVLGTLFGTHRSLKSLQSQVTEAFYQGTDGSGYGISGNLALRVEYARNLCKIAGNYDVEAARQGVEDACTELEQAEDFHEKFQANQALTDAVDTLSRALEAQTLTEEDEGYRKSLTADLASYQMRIDKLASSFNAQVREYHSDIGFPAGLIGALTGVGDVEEYA
jgi:hypothetical protein